MAREILSQHNDNNRNISRNNVRFLTKQILEGEWKLTNQGIGIAKSGRLLDGQHRLQAIIEANQPVQMYVMRDLDEGVFNVIDQGKKRSPGDILSIHTNGEVAWPTAIAAGIRVYYALEQGNGVYVNKKRVDMSPFELIQLYESLPDIEENMKIITNFRNVLNWVPHSVPLGLYTYMKRIDSEVNKSFWHSFNSGANLRPKSPINALRNRLTNYVIDNDGRKPRKQWAVDHIGKAWMLRKKNQGCELLRVGDQEVINFNV